MVFRCDVIRLTVDVLRVEIYAVTGGSNCTLRNKLHRFVRLRLVDDNVDEQPLDDYAYDINDTGFKIIVYVYILIFTLTVDSRLSNTIIERLQK